MKSLSHFHSFLMTLVVAFAMIASTTHAREVDISLPETFTLPGGENVHRESGVFLDRRNKNSIWIGSMGESGYAWFLMQGYPEGVVLRKTKFFNTKEDALSELVHVVATQAMEEGMKVPLFVKDCAKYRNFCESLDMNDTITDHFLGGGQLWVWILVPVTLPLALTADLVWDAVKNVWVISDTVLQSRLRFGKYRMVWSLRAWANHFLHHPGRGRKLGHRQFESLRQTLESQPTHE